MTTDPDQIRGEIRDTQDKLSSDVDALTEKVSPPRVVKRRTRRARTAITGIKDKLIGSAADTASTARDTAGARASAAKDAAGSAAASAGTTISSAASSAADTVGSAPQLARESTQGNPLAVGLIAFAAGWLVSSLIPASPAEKQLATQVKETLTDKGSPVAQQLGQAAQETTQQLRDSAMGAVQSVKDTAAEAAADVTEQARSAAGDVTARAQDAKDTVTEQARPSSP
jgi:hypothetical protein